MDSDKIEKIHDDWVTETMQVNEECSKLIEKYNNEEYCGPYKIVDGISWDDKVIVYQNVITGSYWITQFEPSNSLDELKEQLKDLILKL